MAKRACKLVLGPSHTVVMRGPTGGDPRRGECPWGILLQLPKADSGMGKRWEQDVGWAKSSSPSHPTLQALATPMGQARPNPWTPQHARTGLRPSQARDPSPASQEGSIFRDPPQSPFAHCSGRFCNLQTRGERRLLPGSCTGARSSGPLGLREGGGARHPSPRGGDPTEPEGQPRRTGTASGSRGRSRPIKSRDGPKGAGRPAR